MKIKSKGNKRIRINGTSILVATWIIVAIFIFPALHDVPSHEDQNVGNGNVAFSRSGDARKELRQSRAGNLQPILNTGEEPRYFMVFSTSCDKIQDWQSMAFFYSALKVKQPGYVVRIVSGCRHDFQKEAQIKTFEKKIAPMSPRFSLHITPDFGVKGNMKYWNKPHGLLDWMEKGLGFPERAAEYKNDIILILDPDMMLLRPITHYFDYSESGWVGAKMTNKVVPGIPVAQYYGFGSSWLTSLKGNLVRVVGPESPALNVSLSDAGIYYPAGPPYLADANDMYNIAVHWVRFLPRVHELFPEFMAEMHAYSIAAAHLKLPHQLAKGFMVSDVGASRLEAFDFLQGVTRRDACLADIPVEKLPYVMHYCQRYAVGRWFFSKYKLREDFFDCDAPLMREPPKNVAEMYDWHIFPNGVDSGNYHAESKQHFIVWHAWMLCTVLFSLNEAAIEIKKKHCEPSKANFSKTYHFHEEKLFQLMLNDTSNPFLIVNDKARRTKLIYGIETF